MTKAAGGGVEMAERATGAWSASGAAGVEGAPPYIQASGASEDSTTIAVTRDAYINATDSPPCCSPSRTVGHTRTKARAWPTKPRKTLHIPAVLKVSLTLLGDVTRDADGCTTVGNAVAEVADVAGFVLTSQALVVVHTVDGDVVHMAERHLLDGLFNSGDTALLAHGIGRVVGVAARAIPLGWGNKGW
ncbi:hypothetical protein BC936DRAFT_149103 [Jimgerdemannia flammicorona]|uniref:Uncharacterized protein n=2 Tax=Jimgerdemannia flammicorona TaxID=994334 RepID=A0A433QET0_9FUNG|nr:hypothetical protein BC936DRAFT_149103 [Jimgerdemannia flammicorona]RUS28298.1 hypothetical protein BC938DRAFT_482050 [Jimgerdemannia flammicorona]